MGWPSGWPWSCWGLLRRYHTPQAGKIHASSRPEDPEDPAIAQYATDDTRRYLLGPASGPGSPWTLSWITRLRCLQKLNFNLGSELSRSARNPLRKLPSGSSLLDPEFHYLCR